MHFSTLIAVIPFLGAVMAAPRENDVQLMRRQHPVRPCSHQTGGIHVIAAGGANTNNPKDYGFIGSLATSILKAIPGSTNVSLPYDKVLIQTPGQNPKLQPGAVATGMSTLKQYIVDYHHDCPNTKIALIGYSSGGVITMNDLCGTNPQTQINPALAGKYIIAAVMYGEETRVAGQSFNRGTCKNYSAYAARSNPAGCNPFAYQLQSYCDNGDPDCCTGSGNDLQTHLTYQDRYDGVATQFVVNQLRNSGGA